MQQIEITLEITKRITSCFNATEKQIEQLKSGENPFQETMEREIEEQDVPTEIDYAVNDMDGHTIVDWR